MFVEVCDIKAFVWANSFGADAVTNCIFFNVDNTKSPIISLLPVDSIIVHLKHNQQYYYSTCVYMGENIKTLMMEY